MSLEYTNPHYRRLSVKRAWHLERREIDELVRRACPGIRIPNDIGSREKLTRIVVVIKQRQVKRIT